MKDETIAIGAVLDYLMSYLIRISNVFDDVFLIVDGLDQCQGGNREAFLIMLEDLSNSDMHILACSRLEKDIGDAFSGKSHIEMDQEGVNHDIILYIDSRLNYERRLKKIRSELKHEIREKLLQKSAGM